MGFLKNPDLIKCSFLPKTLSQWPKKSTFGKNSIGMFNSFLFLQSNYFDKFPCFWLEYFIDISWRVTRFILYVRSTLHATLLSLFLAGIQFLSGWLVPSYTFGTITRYFPLATLAFVVPKLSFVFISVKLLRQIPMGNVFG